MSLAAGDSVVPEARRGRVQTLSSSSMRRIIFDGGTFSVTAIRTTARTVGLLIPRSMRLMYVRSNPLSSANCS